MTDSETQWIIVDEREGVGRVDTWSEYLCVMPASEPDKIEIAICRYEMLGEIPVDWFDEEGQPLPEYSDGEGYLKVPEFYEHRYAGQTHLAKLTGHDGEYLLGELACDETFGPPIVVKIDDTAAISEALADLEWTAADEVSLAARLRLMSSGS